MLPGILAASTICAVITAALAGLFASAGEGAVNAAYLWRILSFTLMQAALSTAASLGIGLLAARALNRRREFPGRGALLAAMGAAAALPAILVVFALTGLYGRGSPAMIALRDLGFNTGGIYGLQGIVLAHALLNTPLAARALLHALERVPGESWRISANLGFGARDAFRHVEWPALRGEIPALAALIFLLCATSFAIPLTLGGGPGSATLEVATYEALRFDADFPRAGKIALIQIALAGALIAFAAPGLIRPEPSAPAIAAPVARRDAHNLGGKLGDCAALALAAALILPPLLVLAPNPAALANGFGGELLNAAFASLAIALAAALLAIGFAMAIAFAARDPRLGAKAGYALNLVTLLPLAAPPFALAAGLFALAHGHAGSGALAVPLVILINAMMALPFAYRVIAAPLAAAEQRYGRLARNLRITGVTRLRVVDWPLLKRPLAAAFATSAALSIGDLGVFALFAADGLTTLPYLIYRNLGAYRIAEAEAVAGWLLLLFIAMFAASERLSRADDR